MAFDNSFTAVTGATYTAAQYNTYTKGNLNEIWKYTNAGDLVYATSATALSRLGIGASGYYLTSSGTAPQWTAPITSVQYCSVYHNTTQNILTATPTLVAFNSEYSDLQGWHDTVTNNSRITVAANGYYMAGVYLLYPAVGGSGQYLDTVELLVNGTVVCSDRKLWNVDAWDKMNSMSFPIVYIGASQYAEIRFEQNSGETRALAANIKFSLLRVSA